MKVTKSKENIAKALELYKLIRQAERLAKKIKPLRAHFKPLLDEEDLVLVAGRLAVVGDRKTRKTHDREKLALRLGPEYESFVVTTEFIEVDVQPAIALAKTKEQREKSEEI
jgi:hypothetical protein